MCGITGYISHNEFNGHKMTETLTHRGPDMMGEFCEIIEDKRVYLGHRRLSIIDLSSAGSQPMSTPDDQIVIIYNGEIYNFQTLKTQYLKEFYFHSKTDTEVILYLYQKFGVDFVSLLNGDFAIALLDKRQNQFYLFRDRLGVKPLYYMFNGNDLVFGSEIKAILAAGIKCPINETAIQQYLVFKYTPGQNTLFKDIKRLAPGCFIKYDIRNNELQINRYWKLQKNDEIARKPYEALKAELYNLLEDACKIRLIADVPVGNFFSGGIDSSTIAFFIKDNENITHYCAQKNREDIRKEGTTSDFDYAEKLAKEWQLKFAPIPIGSDKATLKLIRNTLYFSDDLIADGSQIPSYLITKEASATSTVMLSGMGADETFLGYPAHLLTLLSLNLDKLPGFVSKKLMAFFGNLYQGKGSFKSYRRFLHKMGKYYCYPHYKYGLYSIVGDFENSLSVVNEEPDPIIDYISSYFSNDLDPFTNLTNFEVDNFLVKNLHYLDRICMANNVEGRVPFMDHRVVEFAYSLPREYKLSKAGITKRILKECLKNSLPDYVIKRRKAGFGMPLRSIFSTREKVEALLDEDFFGGFSYFNMDNIRVAIDSHISGKEDNSQIIYALISYQIWYQIFVEKQVFAEVPGI